MRATTLPALLTLLLLPAPLYAQDAEVTDAGVGDTGAVGGDKAAVRLEADEIRNYDLPEGFALQGRRVTSTGDGTTLIASTTSQEGKSTCTVIVADDNSAQAYPYQHSSEGTICLGVLPHPSGGFFVRGARAGAMGGEVSGFTARLDAEGNEQWLVTDTETAESTEFKGAYLQPRSPMAYSPSSNYLLTFTLGKLTIGELDEKKVTHVSVLQDGSMRTPAKTLGSGGGFGVIGGVASLDASGDFLLYIYTPSTDGASFFTYDGRESVDQFQPMGADWSTRYVRRMVYGPDQNVYLLWTADDKQSAPAQVSVVDQEAAEIWSQGYEQEIAYGDETKALGAPVNMWVGSRYVALMYQSNGIFLRLIDNRNGDPLGVVALDGVGEGTPLNIVRGRDGRLTLLTVDEQAGRLHEFALTVETGGSGGDAGMVADAGADGGGEADGGGGCSATGNGSLPPVFLVALVLLVGAGRLAFQASSPARQARRGRPRSARPTGEDA